MSTHTSPLVSNATTGLKAQVGNIVSANASNIISRTSGDWYWVRMLEIFELDPEGAQYVLVYPVLFSHLLPLTSSPSSPPAYTSPIPD
jgi:hypothetical protein